MVTTRRERASDQAIEMAEKLSEELTNTTMTSDEVCYGLAGGLFLSGHGLEWNINVLTEAINELLDQHSGNCEVDSIRGDPQH